MKVKTLIEKLEKMDPEAEVRLHDKSGEPVLFVLCAKKYPDVWLQTEGDVDMSDEIQARFDDAIENGTDELDVYMEMLETGIDVPMVRKHLGDEAGGYKTVICIYHKKTLMEHYKTEQITGSQKAFNNAFQRVIDLAKKWN